MSARYPRAEEVVLSDISVRVQKGKTVAVVGESGSGKSTLARVITGLLPPFQGDVRFCGEVLSPALANRGREQLQSIQMIYQMPDVALNPRQKISEIIGRPLEFYLGLKGGEKDVAIKRLLEQIELPADYMDR